MTEPPKRLTAKTVDDTLADLDAKDLGAAERSFDEDDWAYIEAAAALSTFDVETLKPIRPVESHALSHVQRLLENSNVVYSEDGKTRWRLAEPVRKQALQRLGNREAIRAARAANPRHQDDTIDQILDEQLAGVPVDLNQRAPENLAGALQVGDWLAGVVENVPDAGRARGALARARLLEPLRELVGTNFAGRERELRRLRDYVGVRPDGTWRGALERTVRSALNIHERAPMLIWGAGGIGKSTLLARFLLEHGASTGGPAIPFAYLDFDRASVVAEEPASILLEAARQLAVQQPKAGWEEHRERWAEQLRSASVGKAVRGRVRTAGALTEFMAETFADTFSRVAGAGQAPMLAVDPPGSAQGQNQPLLLVLDTFEEVQYRSSEFVAQLWLLFDALQRRLPTLRMVLAGRAPVEGHKTEDLELGALDDAAAIAFLRAQGIANPASERIVARFGGNPLTLRLAADVVQQEEGDTASIEGVATRRGLIFSVDQGVIQGHLYARILAHIHDETVRHLALPALVLRRITPEVILRVLAPHAHVTVRSIADAECLFGEFRREVALVRMGEDGHALEHRADVRRAMLPLIRSDMPEVFATIHTAAIDYYAEYGYRDVVARAEEIYHRLASGEPPQQVDRIWEDEAGERLRNAVDEMSPSAQAYLASRLGVEIDEKVWRYAALGDLRRRAVRLMRDQLSYGDADVALASLEEIPPEQRGPELLLLQARALRALGRHAEATAAIDAALAEDESSSVDAQNAMSRALEIWLEAAEIYLEGNRTEEALLLLRQAQELTRQREDAPGGHETRNLDPTPSAVAATLGVRLREARRGDEARAFLELAAHNGDAMGAYNLGMLYAEGGRTEEAMHWLRVASNEGDHAARYNLGKLLAEHGDVEEAKGWLRQSSDPLARELLATLE
jgi:tetratricopeptide (TPR) repeat protein